MSRHPFVRVCPECWGTSPCDCDIQLIEIDTEIVDDIIALNKRGYVTLYSCQGDDIATPYILLSLSPMFSDLEPMIPKLDKGRIAELRPSFVKLMATAAGNKQLYDLVNHIAQYEDSIRAEYDVFEDMGLRVALYCETTNQLKQMMENLP